MDTLAYRTVINNTCVLQVARTGIEEQIHGWYTAVVGDMVFDHP